MVDPPKFWYRDVLYEAVRRDARLAPIAARVLPENAGFWCPTGWYDLIVKLDEDVAKIDPDYKIVQVKEKFAGLRYYVETASKEAREIIWAAEAQSTGICQECGQPGQIRVHGWHATLCDEHDDANCDRGYFKEKS